MKYMGSKRSMLLNGLGEAIDAGFQAIIALPICSQALAQWRGMWQKNMTLKLLPEIFKSLRWLWQTVLSQEQNLL